MSNINKENKISDIQLFISMLTISAFTFGGGFVIIGMMRKKYCDEMKLISDEEVLDMTAIAQSAPGALAVNSAVIFGYTLKQLKGAIISVIATIIPPLVIITTISFIYDAFSTNLIVQTALHVMRAAVAAIIVDVVIDLITGIIKSKNYINLVLMVIAFVASWYFKVSAITIIITFICIGVLSSLLKMKGGKK